MVRAGFRLVPLLCSGCVQLFDLDDPQRSGPDANNSCPGVEANGRCFVRFNDDATWKDARDRCALRGMTLAKTESAAIILRVAPMVLPTESMYLGASATQPGVYTWLDGSPVTIAAWLPFQPDGGTGEQCMTLLNLGSTVGWHDLPCSELHDYICEYAL